MISNKGQGPPLWTYIVLASLLVIVSVLASPLLKSLEFQKANNARLEAQEIAGLINFIKTSDSYTATYTKRLYQRDCTVEITDRTVTVKMDSGGKPLTATVNLIQTPVKVAAGKDIGCRQGTINIVKTGNLIKVE